MLYLKPLAKLVALKPLAGERIHPSNLLLCLLPRAFARATPPVPLGPNQSLLELVCLPELRARFGEKRKNPAPALV